MAIKLSKKNTNNNLFTAPASKIYRVKRLQSDLNRSFIESSTQQKAFELGYKYIDLYGFPVDTSHLVMIPKEDVVKHRIGVFSVSNDVLYLVSEDYNTEGQIKIVRDLKEKGYEIKKFLGSSLSIQKLIDTFDQVIYGGEVSDEISIEELKIEKLRERVSSLENFQGVLEKTSMTDFMETILIAAIENKASDIHFEPEKLSYNLRLRLDGVLYTYAKLPVERKKKIESRIKILSGVKINVDNVPQDGRFTFKYNKKDIDVRVSMLPSNYGYSVVMRLLGTGSISLTFDGLGFSDYSRSKVVDAINKPQGLILTTGPTGSGKTTTLYTMLNTLNTGGNKIITLEDPIEYKLPGISQTQIDAESGFNFGGGLRSILRQDPDIVMVGEIRDNETADVAVQASLTGHQVLSTIHTNDAAGAIPRLMEMGIRGFILADAASIIIGQRLIRKICPHCKKPHDISGDQKKLDLIMSTLADLPDEVKSDLPDEIFLYKSEGCKECNGTGYKGRIGVYEVLTISDNIRGLISNQEPSIVQVRDAAAKDGMITMLQDGLIKVINGFSDIDELLRAVQS